MPSLLPPRTSSGDHNLLPANGSRGAIIDTFTSISTLFAWTFGSGAVVGSSRQGSPFPFPDTVWAIDLEDMASCVTLHTLRDWYESSRLFPDVDNRVWYRRHCSLLAHAY
jgi:hypothetical protein